MLLRRSIALAAAGALLMACSDDDALSSRFGIFASATATNTCAPNDGPAVGILLQTIEPVGAGPAPSFVNITVAQPLSSLTGTWHTEQDMTGAFLVSGARSFANPGHGTVRIVSIDAASTIRGDVDLDFPNEGRVVGSFRAVWRPTTMLCN